MIRIFFAADIHGNTLIWRKWVNVAVTHKIDVLILAGDLTGKAIVPIIERNGYYEATISGRKYTAKDPSSLDKIKELIENMGYYYALMTPAEAIETARDPKRLNDLFQKVMARRLHGWLNLLLDKIDTKKIISIVMPGNDDEQFVEDIIKSYADRNIISPLDKKVILPSGYEMISHEFVTPTPWKTPREVEEDGLYRQIEEKIKKFGFEDPAKLIFNFHCPPYNTNLDLAPKLDKNLKIVLMGGKPLLVHVGSVAIRKLIEKYQPLLGLHGHIHESYAEDRIGKTVVLNPGSEYTEGILRSFLIELDATGLKQYWKMEG
ncbi:MAG: metallophosphoesterase [Candidatus Bathyarchaeia archaeon]